MDFGFGNESGDKSASGTPAQQNGDNGGVTDLNTGSTTNIRNGEDVTDIDFGNGVNTPAPDDNGNDDNKPNDTKGGENDDNKGSKDGESNAGQHDLEPGSILQVGDDKYTVAENGNLVDKDGNVFKEAKDVADFIKDAEFEDDGDENELNVNSVQEALGIEITDEDGKPLEFENTPEGVKAYVQAVVDLQKEEYQEAAIASLYQKYPIINDVLNYYIANGNSLEGFNQTTSYSDVTFDESNADQHEQIVRIAFKEQGRKGDVESYIQYLKSSGILAETAREELNGLVEIENESKEEIARKAEEAENKRIEQETKYWNGVKETIDKKVIAGYKIPDTILINNNGVKVTATPNDFFDYVYKVDQDGLSKYERDLQQETKESRLNDELLRAYLKFVKGDYSSLVGMAVNEDKVKKLKFKANQQGSGNQIRVIKPTTKPKTGSDTDLGYK